MAEEEKKPTTRGWLKLAILAGAVIGLFVASRFLPLGEYLGAFLDYTKSLGVLGLVLLALVYIVATVFMVPGTILTLGAGAAFGLVQGTLAVMVGSVLGALAAFLVGRYFARDFVEQKARENPRFNAIDRAVEREGFKIVLLTRLSPVFPFNLLNYLFSITKVRTRDYFFASWLGMVPGTIMYVYLGAAAGNLTQVVAREVEKDAADELFWGIGWQDLLWGVGLLATVVVTVYVTRIARAALNDYVEDETPPKDA